MATGVLVGRGYVSIRPEFEGDWSRTVNARASSAGRSGAGAFSKSFGAGLKTIGGLAAVAVAANISNIAAASAALAPALATAGTAAAALKIGLSGVGDAFKAAFADSSAEASSAASATRAVEGAQRGLANAQRALADARVQAAERVREAQRQVADAERELSDAQRDARQVQGELNGARQDAARALQDMNQQLAESRLGEREAVLRLKQATDELKAAEAKKGVSPDELERLRIAYERARLNLTEQRTETKRLADDTKKANKAGVEGSQQVLSAKERIADANRTVADRERALGEAQADVSKAHAEGQRSIADAQRAVADAAAAVADAQAAAAAQTSKLDTAMAKLAPNARSFVNAIRGLAPAWTAMRLSVQNRLFEGLGATVSDLGRQTIPILQRQLTATAGIWNTMAKSAAGAISEMARSGMLEDIMKGANRSFAQFKDTPGQLVTAFGQLSLAAQPAFERLMGQFAGAIKHFTDGIAASFTSGGLQQGIDTAFQILSQLGTLLGNAFGVVTQIFKAASDAGGQIIGVLSAVFKEIGRILAMPEVQAQLRVLFASVAQIVGAIVPVLGALIQVVVPLLAAIAPAVASIAVVVGPVLSQLATALAAALTPIITTLGPVLVQLVTSLTSALTPIITALLPVITQVGVALLQIVQAVTPLLAPIGQLITSVITALAPALTPIINIVTQLVKVLVGPLTSIITALTPAFVLVGQLIAQVFQALEPFLAPLVNLIGQVATLLAGIFSQALGAVMAGLKPLIPVGMQLVQSVVGALAPILPILGQALTGIANAFLQLLGPLSQVWVSLAKQLAPVIGDLAPIVAQLGAMLAGALAAVLPPLINVLLILVNAFKPIFPLISEILGIVVSLGASLIAQLLPPLLKLIQAGVNLVVALVPILPPLAQIIGLVVQLAVRVLSWLLPPLVSLVSLLVGRFAGALSTAIGWLAGLVNIFAKVVLWVTTKLGPSISWLWTKIRTDFQSIGDKGTWLWNRALKPAFDLMMKGVDAVGRSFRNAKDFIGRAWSQLQDIAKKPVKFLINTIYNGGIVPTWNKVATAFGANPIKPMVLPQGFAAGGVLPGYTPGRDVHRFISPTGGALDLSGGEAIMRPEFTRGAGAGFVNYFNRIAKSRGAQGVKAALAPALGGSAPMRTQRFADGGIWGWIKNTAAGVGSKAWDGIKKTTGWLTDTLEASARAGVKAVVDPLLKNFPGADTGFGKMIRKIPSRILNTLFGYTKTADKKGGGGIGGPRIQAALRWARTQNGLPYQWAGNGDPSWDCSGLMSAIESVIRGQKPHRRWATMAFSGKTAPPGWVLNGKSPFTVGITNAGVGHTAGTLGGVNVESRGGDGVVVGKRARGSQSMLFNSVYGFMPGKYDSGGWLQPGWNYNGLRTPEAVMTPTQLRALTGAAAAGQSGTSLDGQRLRLVVRDREFDAYLESVADGRVAATLRPLTSAARAGRKG